MENMHNTMTKDNKLAYLKESYNTLRASGKVKTWTDFAILLDINRSCLSAAKQGDPKYLTDSLIDKVRGIMTTSSVTISNSPGSSVVNGDNNKVEISNGRGISAMATPYQNMKCVPTIPIHAYRAVNFDVMRYFEETQDELRMSPIVMQFPGTDCYYFVNSEDMTPHLQTNDLLCLAKLPTDAKVTNGDICIINTKYQGIIERFVYDEGDHLLVKSTQPRWTDMRIPKDEIFNIFRILGGIRTNI